MFTVCCPRCFQSLCSFPSIVDFTAPWKTFPLLLPFVLPFVATHARTHTHAQTHTHSLAPSQTGQLQKASAMQADEKWQLSVSLAGSDNWQMDTAHTHSHTDKLTHTHAAEGEGRTGRLIPTLYSCFLISRDCCRATPWRANLETLSALTHNFFTTMMIITT